VPERHHSSSVHGFPFPHIAGCRQCHYEHRCDRCGNSRGHGSKSLLRHGAGRCEPKPAADAQRLTLEIEQAIDRTQNWLYARLTATRSQRPSGGVCGFTSIGEFRAFALSEATAALGGSPNIGQLLRLELAVRNMYEPLALLCAAIEAPSLGA
jgi:hypothetical protein